MNILSIYSRQKKLKYFFKNVPKLACILEVGSGTGFVGKYLKKNGWSNYTSIDLISPADYVGDIRNWEKLGLKESSFDIIVAFEVLEHGDFLKEFRELLKPGGLLFITTPVPQMDWLLKFLEDIGLNQKRTSVHNNLICIKNISGFKTLRYKSIFGLAQWGIYKK